MKINRIGGETEFTHFEFELENTDWESCPVGAVYDFLADIKSSIPKTDRSYAPETKVWTILGTYWDKFKEIKDKHFIKDPKQDKLPF